MVAASEPGWLTGLNFTITDAPAPGGGASGGAAMPNSGSGGGGSFSLSVDEARSMLTTAKRVRDQLGEMRFKANGLLQLQPPADDPGSTGYNKVLVGGPNAGAFNHGTDAVEREYRYAAELVIRLEQALGITEAAQDQAGTDVKNAASANQDKGFA
ncbi:hypothetical protein [Amycolatopsis sp. NPDC051903]|uniref:hypothetical protein n=1 Tax=Amycolatopsis sp. NPDC051903 TaxID=3363936 RepID=UPI0037A6949B